MQLSRSNLIIEVTQALIWACVFLLPSVIALVFFRAFVAAWWAFRIMLIFVLPIYIAYLLNYYYIVPRFLYRGNYPGFFLSNIIMLVASFLRYYFDKDWTTIIPEKLSDDISLNIINAGYSGFIALELVFQVMVVLMAVGMRYVIKWNDEIQALEEEKRRNAEAELTWLKNQLNPHFLFNTFNNISSLTQTDPDKAQESISQLSELLRYALYESNTPKVSLADEVAFMQNYIDLMTLRCSDTASIQTRFDDFDSRVMISPLVFISLIENAFKHGISAHRKSFVKIDMGFDGSDLVFSCENSIHGGTSTDRSGSGIGLENMTRRLELLYPGSYSYSQFADKDTYVAIVRLKNIISNV